MTRVAMMTAALGAAVVVWGWSLPPRSIALDRPDADGTVRGVLHVHSRASDGRGTFDDIAAAAAAAGLQFVVVSDHGDGTRRPEPPSYRSGVLMLDAVEISTRGGHYLALGLPQAPYPLGGAAADVVADVHRLGAFGIAAHPDSPKPALRWTDWSAPIDGLELINPDTSWRVHAFSGGAAAKWLLFRSLLAYPFRAPEALTQLLTESDGLRGQWLAMAATRPVVALAGADAHARIALSDTEPGENGVSIPIPGYAPSFESLTVHAAPLRPFAGDGAADAQLLLEALRAGRAYLAVDGWASPASFTFTATQGSQTVSQGGRLQPRAPVTLHVRSNAPGGFETRIWRGRDLLLERSDREVDLEVGPAAGAYMVEVRRPNSPGMPAWVTSNAIVVAEPAAVGGPPAPAVRALPGGSLFDGRSARGWSYESDPASRAVVDVAPLVSGARIRLRYGLAAGGRAGQYAAAAVETADGLAAADGLAFAVRGEGPMRISVQVRADTAAGTAERWETSVYVDASEQERLVRFADLRPVGAGQSPHPPLSNVRAIVFVVDTTNAAPGASGRLWLGDVRLVSITS